MSAPASEPREPVKPAPAKPNRLTTAVRLAVLIALILVVRWAFAGIDFDFSDTRRGLRAAGALIAQMLPRSAADRAEDIASFKGEWGALIQTLQMALIGTLAGALIALPISFFAARTTSLFRPLSVLIKTCLNVVRAIPVLIYALIVVSAIGLGAPAGAFALAFGSLVMLAKLYAEGLESIAPGPVEAVKATGGNAIQTFVFGMLPQVFPNYLSATLYAFEINISASAILGFVGAGGIGFDLQNDMRLYNLLDTGVLLFMLIVLVNAVDYLSYRIRQLFM
jgi:phosphonate transport system permease protein